MGDLFGDSSSRILISQVALGGYRLGLSKLGCYRVFGGVAVGPCTGGSDAARAGFRWCVRPLRRGWFVGEQCAQQIPLAGWQLSEEVAERLRGAAVDDVLFGSTGWVGHILYGRVILVGGALRVAQDG